MALGASIFKANVNISNLNTHFYDSTSLTLAKHPSEGELRMMYRLCAFLYSSNFDISFTKGLSSTEEPEMWHISPTGEILEWIELGLPDNKRVRQACGKSSRVNVFTYHKNKTDEWFRKFEKEFLQLDKLSIIHISVDEEKLLEDLAKKNMSIDCMIEDNTMYLSSDEARVNVSFKQLC